MTSTAATGLRVLAAPDKFRGTATAPEVCAAIAAAARSAGAVCRELPLADGGEGTLDVFGGANRQAEVTGPLGRPVTAGWRLDGDRAVIEMAAASGLLLAGGAEGNDPMAATTIGTGELIAAALARGARDILVGVGGSATTDGGAGALSVLAPDGGPDGAPDGAPNGGPRALPPGVRLRVCADVRTRFLDAATIFGPQKGATPEQIVELTARLAALREHYRERFGVDVQAIERSGAAGGLAGGLAAIGADLVDGFGTLAAEAGLDRALADADLVITGEGRFDAQSLDGKVTGEVITRARSRNLPVLVIAGAADPSVAVSPGVTVTALVDLFGIDAALADTAGCVQRATAGYLQGHLHGEPAR